MKYRKSNWMNWLLCGLLCFSSSFSVINAEETGSEEGFETLEQVIEEQPDPEISEEDHDHQEDETDPAVEHTEVVQDETGSTQEENAVDESSDAEAAVLDADDQAGVMAEGTCGNITWTLMSNGHMEFLGEGAMPDYTESSPAPWAAYSNDITSLEFGPGITEIGDYAFYNCRYLYEANIQSGLDIKSIGDYAFYGCAIQIVQFNQNVESIGDHAFENNKALSKADILGGNLSSISPSAFDGCDNLEEFYVSPDNTVFRSIDGWLCKGTELIYCPQKLRKGTIRIPDGITTAQYGVFKGCTELTKVTLPESFIWHDFIKLGFGKSAGPVGSGCDIEFEGTSASIPANWYSDINELYGDYSNNWSCWDGTKLIIPEGVMRIEENAMGGVDLKYLFIPSTVSEIRLGVSDVCGLGGPLTTIEVDQNNPCYASKNGALLSKDMQTFLYCPRGLKGEFTVPDGVKIIGEYAFDSCYYLESAVIPEGVTTIRRSAFNLCLGLKEVYLPLSLKTIEEMAFYDVDGYTAPAVYYSGSSADAELIDIDYWNSFSEWHNLGGESTDYAYFITFDKNNDNAAGTMSGIDGYFSDGKKLPANSFSCSGMKFTGWNTSPDGTGISYADQESISEIYKHVGIIEFGAAFITLYAQWETAVTTYPVVYELDGGTDGPEIQYKVHGEILILSTKQPVREGYTFIGWATSLKNARNGKAQYAAGKTVKIKENKRLTLYAVWKEKTFKVTYNANGGKSAPSAQTKYYTKQLTLSSKVPARTGYIFVGWEDRDHIDEGAVNTVYQSGASYTINDSVTLYAVWSPIYYTVEFVGNGADNTMESVTLTYDTSFQLVSSFVRTGYTLNSKKAWKCSNKKTYADGAVIKNLSTKNGAVVKMTAQWTANTYTVRFNRGTAPVSEVKGNQMPDKKYTYDKEKALPKISYTAAGYVLDHWSAQNGKQFTDKQKVKNIVPSGEVTLTAVWREKEYPISYILNGGTNPEGTKTYLTITSDDFVLPSPARTGYKFAGWYTNKSFKSSTKIEMIPGGSTKAYTVYAKWEPIHYSVRYTAGADDAKGTMASQTKENIAYGTYFKLAANKYTREGYVFDSWSDGRSCYKPGSIRNLTTVDGDTVIMTAVWKPNTVTLKLNSNYPDGSANKTVTKKLTIEDTLPGIPDGFENKGTIISWNTKADGSGTKYNVGDLVSSITKASGKTFTLYAQWIQGADPTVFYSNYDEGYMNQCKLNTYAMLVEAIADRNKINEVLGTEYSDVREYMRVNLCGGVPWQPITNIRGMLCPFDLVAQFKTYTENSGQYSEDFIKTELSKTSSHIGAIAWKATAVISETNKIYNVPHMVMVYLDASGELRLFDPGLEADYGKGAVYHNHVTDGNYWQDIIFEDFYTVERSLCELNCTIDD